MLRIYRIKALKQAREMLRCYSRSVIGDANPTPHLLALVLAACLYMDLCPDLGGVFDRIFHEICQHL